jgi:hypothetical protein
MSLANRFSRFEGTKISLASKVEIIRLYVLEVGGITILGTAED